MTHRMKHWDAIFATVGMGGTLATVNTLLATVIATLTILMLALRLRKEWNNRNKPPDDDKL